VTNFFAVKADFFGKVAKLADEWDDAWLSRPGRQRKGLSGNTAEATGRRG
jgi:hypothetical protein